ncbi:MAG: selenide, water dikinase SelD, partial [Calditrichales bacterium]
EYLKKQGFEITYLPVSSDGVVDMQALRKAIRKETILITIMHANNEVGTIQPITEIGKIARAQGIVFHSDGAQSVGKISTRVRELGVDLYSLAGHKLYAPKGIGVLYKRQGIELEKLIHGADHENNQRAGTENILEIVGLGKACELAQRNMAENEIHFREMRDRLVAGLQQNLKGITEMRVNGMNAPRLPNTASVSFSGIEANTLLAEIEDRVAASAGAACHSENVDLSATLEAMVVPIQFAMGTIRFSTGKPTTEAEIDTAVNVVTEAIRRLKPGADRAPQIHTEDTIKLTHFTHGLGCACKLRPQALEQVLASLPVPDDKNILVGIGTSDDAAVYRINEEQAIVQTVDFFTPVVDDPYAFGQIAAANALSDIYAMGAKPLFALNIVGFPSNRLPLSVLESILKGAQEKAAEAGISIIGGHTVDDTEPKFGLAVCGIIHPHKILSNATAQPGDVLILTKPIGTGILSTALKRGALDAAVEKKLIASMSALNANAAEVLANFEVHACTDVTGFGLLGHLKEMTTGSGVDAEIQAETVPLLDSVTAMAQQGMIPGGTNDNLSNLADWVEWHAEIGETMRLILCDAQTSGGLLIAVRPDQADALVDQLHQAGIKEASIVGRMTTDGKGMIRMI